MFDYLQQFNNLPQNLRDQVSSPSAMARIADLEAQYKVELAIVVMKIMVKSLQFSNLPIYLVGELSMTSDAANQLVRDLKEKIFAPLADYLGLTSEIRAWDLDKDISIMIKEAGLVLPSAVAVSRFKNIVATYARGVRSKIDTRNTLAKDVKIGGLNLSPEEINRVLKICDTRLVKGLIKVSVTPDAPSVPAAAPLRRPADRLDKIISGADKKAVPFASEYNLKEALAKGETKSVAPAPAKLDTRHELAKPGAQLDLPKPVATPSPVVPTAPIKPISNPKIINPVTRPASHLESLRPNAPKITSVSPTSVSKAASVIPVSPAAARNLAGRQAPAPADNRPQMHDIKPMPKIMGPIEELQFLDVANFRRLGATPAEITSKLFTKIKLLEKDGYDKMVAGVRAWRQSPVSRLYLRLGQEAIAKGQSMKEAAASRQATGQDYLSMEEIEAVVSLNGKLVF